MKKFFLLVFLTLFSFAVSAQEAQKDNVFYFFYSYKCPHCHEAQPFIEAIEHEYTDITFKKLEVLKVPENMSLFRKMTQELGIQGGGVPTFIFNGKFIVGFQAGHHDALIREMIEMNKADGESCGEQCQECKENVIDVPVLGKIDAVERLLLVVDLRLGRVLVFGAFLVVGEDTSAEADDTPCQVVDGKHHAAVVTVVKTLLSFEG